MLTRLTVQHYKSLENVDLELGPLTVLVGRNGSGKSNIVDAVSFLQDAATLGLDHAVTDRHGFHAISQWSSEPNENETAIYVEHQADIHNTNKLWRYGFTIAQESLGYFIHKEQAAVKFSWVHKGYNREVVLEGHSLFTYVNGVLEQEVKVGHRSADLELLDDLGGDWFEVAEFEAYSIFPNTLREPQKLSQSPFLTQHGDNLASVLRQMAYQREQSPLPEIESLMGRVLPRLHRISVQSLGGYILPRFLMREESGEEHYFDVNHLSDGTLRILGILVALYQDPGPPVIALEEPELTVHPGALPLLADAMKEASKRRQVIVTTHSPDLLDQFDPDVIRVVEMDERGVTTVSPLSPTQVKAVRDHLFTLGQLMSIEGLHS